MMNRTILGVGLVVGLLLALGFVTTSTAAPSPLPDPAIDAPLAKTPSEETAVLAGGCFWGVEAVFEHVKGVKLAESGYSGGTANTANYDLVSRGNTGHAEAVRVIYDPAQISYGRLLKIFFSVAHDPTQLNRQGPDIGPQYRSAIFPTGEEQKRIAEAYILQLREARVFPRLIVTKVTPLEAFYQAEEYHQDYAKKNPRQPYIMMHDAPKVARLKTMFPDLFVAR
jgi:peptide-methionine (S)-S-oxide reductase